MCKVCTKDSMDEVMIKEMRNEFMSKGRIDEVRIKDRVNEGPIKVNMAQCHLRKGWKAAKECIHIQN